MENDEEDSAKISQILLNKACDSLLLSIEFFNRPVEKGRTTSCLILLDHSFEMLLKAAILYKHGNIIKDGETQTIGFEKCVGRGLSEDKIKFLDSDQARMIRAINLYRDATQHYWLEISEKQLYMSMQSGVTVFNDVLHKVFSSKLIDFLPKRVLPISTLPPVSLQTLFEEEIEEVKKILEFNPHKKLETNAKLLPLVLFDLAAKGISEQPSEKDMENIKNNIKNGKAWQNIFSGVAALEITTDPNSYPLNLRSSKKEGAEVNMEIAENDKVYPVVIKRVNELDIYNITFAKLSKKLGLNSYQMLAAIYCLNIRQNEECSKEFRFSSTIHRMYSQKAIELISDELSETSMETIKARYKQEKVLKNKKQGA